MSTGDKEVGPEPIDNFVEMSQGDPEKDGVHREGADYSGAVKKSSPEEIALVRKLDVRIMVSLIFDKDRLPALTSGKANSLVHVLLELCEHNFLRDFSMYTDKDEA